MERVRAGIFDDGRPFFSLMPEDLRQSTLVVVLGWLTRLERRIGLRELCVATPLASTAQPCPVLPCRGLISDMSRAAAMWSGSFFALSVGQFLYLPYCTVHAGCDVMRLRS